MSDWLDASLSLSLSEEISSVTRNLILAVPGWEQEDDSAAQPHDRPEHDDGHAEGEHDQYGPHDGGGGLDQLALLWLCHH